MVDSLSNQLNNLVIFSDECLPHSQPSSSSDIDDDHATSKRKKTTKFGFPKRRLMFQEVRSKTDKTNEDIPTQNNMSNSAVLQEEIQPDQNNLETDETRPTVDNEITMNQSQKVESNFSIYVSSKEEEDRNELAARTVGNWALIKRIVIWGVPSVITDMEVETALLRQGVMAVSLRRTRQGNFIVELGDPSQFKTLLHDGFDLFGRSRFTITPLPLMGHQYLYDDLIVQCYNCQGFWHFAEQCPGPQRCKHCGGAHNVANCPRPRSLAVCLHCSGSHHAGYKRCPVRQQMKFL